ncbi:DNA primase [Peptostreptococcus russellii]|uniref:DNA primase n=1 Tax=Peptostreptococcus russellii TaxID=215200 RepID=A0A1H8ENK6_9FIRM|nr:DNA primase [Peptostreptococcus russellii]SEN20970.1 DNA primase [Peptostreptococcus russellii]
MDDLKDVIEEIKVRNDISEVISDYIQLRPSGSNYKGLCPFHNEKTPSFHVSTSKQIYKCFGCGEGGDVISFIMKVENLEFMDAVKFLANRCGIEINTNIDENTKKKLEKIKRFQEIHVVAARFFYINLMQKNNTGYKYLIKRGLDEKTIKSFGLGYSLDSWDSLKNFLLKSGYSIEEIKECGLVGQSKKNNNYFDKFRNRVMFPIFDYKGNVIGFGGRVLDDSLPKYLNSEDTIIFNKRYNLYGLNFARKHIGNSRTLILVEGYMDLISMYQYGVKNVVATLGTALTDAQGQLIKKFADNVVLSYDSDQAGINASLRAINILEKCNLKAKVLDLGKSKDPDEFVRANGLDEMLKKVENASDALKFRLDTLYSSHDQSNPEETMEFLQKAVNILSYIKSPIELDFYIKYLSELTKTAPEVIRSELNLTGKRKTSKEKFKKQEFVKIKKEKDVEDGNIFIERNLIKAMMVSKKAREIIPLKVGIDQIIDESDKKVYSKVLASNKMGMIRIEDLNDTSLDVDYLRKLDAVDLSEINLDDVHEINKIVNQLLKLNSKEKINKLSKRQKVLEDRRKTIEDNTEEAKEVDLEIMKIALEIVSENKKLKSF